MKGFMCDKMTLYHDLSFSSTTVKWYIFASPNFREFDPKT